MELAPSVSATKQSHTKTLIQGFVKFDFDDVYVPALGNFHVKSQYPRLKPKFERGKVDNGIVEATCDQLLVWVNQHFDTTGREKYFKELVLSSIVYTINVDPQLLFHSEQMELTLRIFFWLWYGDDVLEAAVSNGIDHKALKLGTDQIQSILTGKYDHDPVPKFNDVPDYPIFRNLFNSLLEWYNTCRNSLQEYENLIKPLANNLTTYFTTMRWFRVDQIDGRYSEETFKTYRKVTAFSDGIANAMALINGIKLTDEMANSVIMKRLLDIANAFGGYANDLLGMKKEFTNGERENLIVFLVLEKKVPLDEAVQQVCDLLADELTDYVLLREVILSEFDHDENLSRYLDNLDSLIDGHNKIYSLSLRHRAVGSVSLTR